jgi:hypothetical protein
LFGEGIKIVRRRNQNCSTKKIKLSGEEIGRSIERGKKTPERPVFGGCDIAIQLDIQLAA